MGATVAHKHPGYASEMTVPTYTQARVHGSVGWICPNCGSVNRPQVRPCDLKVRCYDRQCQRTFTLVLIPVPRGRRNLFVLKDLL
jgi:hypothetical protein